MTSSDGKLWQESTPAAATGTAAMKIDETKTHQEWDGMGGAFNEVGWQQLKLLSDADKAKALNDLFGADGADFVLGRIPIGASDYALTRYTLDDTSGDYSMDHFSVDHDQDYLIPYVKAALGVKSGLRLWASPWTPPAWMKDNNSTDKGNMKSDEQTLNAFALYLAKFVEEYGKQGITIEAIHPQNEPGYLNPYPSCAWTEATYISFIGKYLGPLFASRSVQADIWCGTMSAPGDGTIATDLATQSANSDALGYVKGFGLQWNTMSSVSTLTSKGRVWQTEHKCGNYRTYPPDYATQLGETYNADKAPNDYKYAQESWMWIRDWVQAGVNAYSAWNMVLDEAGKNNNSETPWPQNALLIVSGGKLVETPTYFVFKHVSHFVHAGAKRIEVTGAPSGVDSLAFKNSDGTKVAIFYNSGSSDSSTSITVGSSSYALSIPSKGFATISAP